MKVSDIVHPFQLMVYVSGEGMERECTGAYVSDLLSDVMGNANSEKIWITMHSHLNIIAVATLKDIPAIIITKGMKPNDETLKKAKEENICVLGTKLQTFEFAGQLYHFIHNKE